MGRLPTKKPWRGTGCDEVGGSRRGDGQWGTGQAPGVGAVAIAAGDGRRRNGERQELGAAAARPGELISVVRDRRGWHGSAAAAGVEVVATERHERRAAVVDRAAAVPGPEGCREAQEARVRGAASARGSGIELARHVVLQRYELRLDDRSVTRGGARGPR